MHRSTYHVITPKEIDGPTEEDLRERFYGSIEINIGDKASIYDFEELGMEENPTYDLYKNDDEDGWIPKPPAIELERTPEAGYI